MKTVNILLSTYNGQAFLSEQLDSIRAQNYPDTVLHVRDDGSTDNTPFILKKRYGDGEIKHLDSGRNIGVVESYFRLLEHADTKASFYAFADQDDIWMADKIARAVKALSPVEVNVPAIYCGRLKYIDSGGAFLGYSSLPRRGLSFNNALVENVVAGCTIVMNRAAREIILSHLPKNCAMHDWWCYIVVSAFGKLIYDKRPGIAYRLHQKNDIGAFVSFMDCNARRVKRFFNEGRHAFKSYAQAVEFSICFGDQLSGEMAKELNELVLSTRSLRSRYRYARHKAVYRQSRIDDWALGLLICLNRYYP